jgi:probable phosphoglycerate mutase
MTTFLLIRHATNDFVGKRLAGWLPGVHLNETGRQQAEKIAQALAKAPIKAIYSSPLERAMETAAPLAQALNLEIKVQPGLSEINFGKWQGKTAGQLKRLKLWKVVQQNPSQMHFPDGESFSEAQQRLVDTINAITASHGPKDLVACFSHCDAIRLVVTHFLGMPLDFFQRLSIDIASVTVLMLGEHGAHLGPINYIPGMSFEMPPEPEKKEKKAKDMVEQEH